MLSKEVLSLRVREALGREQFQRRPGASVITDDPIELRETEDAWARAFFGVYHFCALATSRLVPNNGLVLDLGCGSAAFAIYLAKHRPDITIMGIESRPALVELAHEMVEEACLEHRIAIYEGEITAFSKRVDFKVDMITSILGLHTVATSDDLLGCFKEISLVRMRSGCAVFLFDYVRPLLARTAEELPIVMHNGALHGVQRYCRNALVEAFTYEEMSEALGKVALGTTNHAQSTGLKVYQAHWLEREDGLKSHEEAWEVMPLQGSRLQQFRDIASVMPKVKLPVHMR